MRVLYISDVYFPRINGVSTSIQTFRAELAALGHQSLLIAPEYPAAYEESAGSIRRVPSRRVPVDPEDRAMRWGELKKSLAALRAEDFDLVHIQTPFLAHYAGLATAREWGLPCVATYHTLFEEYLFHYVPFAPKESMRALARRFSRGQCNALDAIVVPSTAMRDTLRRYGVERDIVIIPTGIPAREFITGDGARFRTKHGLTPDAPLSLFVGRVAFEKNIDFLLRAHAELLSRLSGAVLMICGEGPALPSLRRLTVELGIEHAVRFLGYLDRQRELPDCYSAADVFVFASRTETQGLVLLEAMALGIPVLSTAMMGAIDIVRPQRGAIESHEDVHVFADHLHGLFTDAQRRARMGEEGRAFAQEWGARAMAQRMAACYGNLINSRSVVVQPA